MTNMYKLSGGCKACHEFSEERHKRSRLRRDGARGVFFCFLYFISDPAS